MTSLDPILTYAKRAFADNPQAIGYFLREVARPGEFDRLAAKLLAEAKAQQNEALHPAEERIVRRSLRDLRKRMPAFLRVRAR